MPEMEKGRAPENKRSRKPAHPVKRDVNEDMKNFAENTMNELLGWYGYNHVDLRDSPDSRHQAKRNHISVLKENSVPKPNAAEKNVPSSSSEPVKNSERESAVMSITSSSSSSISPRSREQHNMNVVVPLIKPSAVEDVQNVQIICVWCQKEGIKRYSLLMGSDLKSFCSEKCFAACRRAYFKRNKARDEDRHGDQSPPPGQTLDTPTRLLLKMNSNTRVCDWCKHIRHTKEYLDFGSGEERVQFCSTKCLNQYKMDVFYREARAALNGSDSKDEENNQRTGDNQKLLTPESWDSSPAKTLSPKTPTPLPTSVSVLNTASSSSSARTPVTSQSSRSCPLQIHTNTSTSSAGTSDQQRPPHITLPFVRPPLHALGLRSPAPHPPRNPASPIQRPPHPHYFAPHQTPPLLQPYPSQYVPFHPAYPPQLPPPWPQPTMLLPYPVIVPLPVPIPIPIPVSRHAGVIRSLREQEETSSDVTSDPGETSGDQVQPRIKTEQTASPLTISLPSLSVGSSERQVIQCLHRHTVKEEVQDGTTAPSTPENPTHVYTNVLRKALKRHAGNVMSVVTPIASASSDDKTATPASLYSLARSTAAQVASVSLDGTHRSDSASDVPAGSAQIPSPLSDCEDVKENSYVSGRENGLTNPWSAEQTDCQSDQSKESVVTEDSSQDAEHTYARSVPPKLREKNTHVTAQTTTQTHSWEKNTHTVHQSSEPNGRDDPEPALKRRCLRIRDQNK